MGHATVTIQMFIVRNVYVSDFEMLTSLGRLIFGASTLESSDKDDFQPITLRTTEGDFGWELVDADGMKIVVDGQCSLACFSPYVNTCESVDIQYFL